MSIPKNIKDRYFRPVISHPEGKICHHADCHFWSWKICTCGLIHDLNWICSEHPDMLQLYPNLWEEWGKQEHALDKLRNPS